MSLYGALFSGVSGLSSQSSAMGAISDNISNVNTIGYKGTQVNFQTLITQQTSLTAYSPGGVQSKPRGGIDIQGLLQATTSSTDVALSGQGFFVVNSTADPANEGGTFAYTRAGSFKPDQYGNLKNAAGFYMQGWPLVPNDGSSAATPGSTTINGTSYMKAYKNADGTWHYINQNTVSSNEMKSLNINTIGGTAQATSSVAMGANLPSGDPIYSASNPSAGGLHTTNVQVYDSLGNPGNAQFTWTKTGQNTWQLQATPPSGAAVLNLDNYTTPLGVPTTVTYASQGQLEFASVPPAGSYFTMSSMVGTSLQYVKVQFYNSSAAGASGLDPTTSNPLDVVNVPPNTAGSQNLPYVLGVDLSGISDSASVASRLASAIQSSINQPSLKNTGNIATVLNGGMADGANRFSASSNTLQIIQEPGGQALNFDVHADATTLLGSSIVQSGTGVGSGANLTNPSTVGQFTVKAISATYVDMTNASYKTNNLTVNAVNAGTANGTNAFSINSVGGAGHLIVGGVDLGSWATIGGATPAAAAANVVTAMTTLPLSTTFANMGISVSAAGGVLTFTTASGPATVTPNAGGNATDVTWSNGTSGTATESVPTSPDVLTVGNIEIPWSEIVAGRVTTYTDLSTGAVHSNANGFTAPVILPHGATGTDTTALTATDMDKLTANLAFLMDPTTGLFAAGAGHPANPGIAGAKVDPNKTTQLDITSQNTPVTLYVNNADVTWANGKVGNAGPQTMGQIGQYSSSTGAAVTFNGNGTPANIIPNAMEMYWANGAEDQHGNKGSSTVQPQVSLDLGDLNQSNGLTQLGGKYQVSYMTQNGAKFGNFSGISVGSDGIVTALFDNGVRSPVFQIPITTFANPDGLQSLSGNVWIETSYSGAYTVRAPGEAGSGTVQQSSLESSTVDIGTEFTSMITVQNAYSAAAKVITTTDQLLTQLINIKQ